MSEYLFPIPGSVLRGLLDRKAQAGEQFSEKEVLLDLMLDIDEGKKMTLREYETRWKTWSFATISRRLPELKKEVQKLRNWNGLKKDPSVKQRETGLQQDETENAVNDPENTGDETGLQQDETGLQQAHLIHARATELQNYNTTNKNLNNNQPPTKSKRSARTRASLPDGLTYDMVFDSWNAIASELGFPVVQSRTDKRKKTILRLAARLWPKMDQVYENMRNGNRWFRGELRPGFDWVWNETNFTKIYEGNYLHDRDANKAGSTAGHNGTASGRTLEDDFDAAFAEMLRDREVGRAS